MQSTPGNAPAYQALTRANEVLGDLISRPPGSPDWVREVQHSASTVFDILHQHQAAAEGADGILRDVAEHRPALVPQSDHLASVHGQMLEYARDLQREAESQLSAEDFDFELIRLKATVLRDLVRLHLREAGVLTYEAYYRVEGGQGG